MTVSTQASSIYTNNEKASSAYMLSAQGVVKNSEEQKIEDNGLHRMDTVEISVEAKMMMSAKQSVPTHPYAKYFPTRDGEPANALALAVTNPSAESFSKGKSLDQVVVDARAEMDAKYASMQSSGKPFDINSNEGKDWSTLFENFDRRTLYAVKSNEGGKFTKQEQDMADSTMSQQEGLAMGLYSGPIRLQGSFVDPFGGDFPQQLKAEMKFLDGVSSEEKSSAKWQFSRATAERTYEYVKTQKDEKIDEGENLVVKLTKEAMKTVKKNADRQKIESYEELKKQAWLKGFDEQLKELTS
jgi:hypothetical protein